MDPDPPGINISPCAATSMSDSRQICKIPTSSEVLELAGLVTAYTLSPKPATQTAGAAAAMNSHPPSTSPPGHGQFIPASHGVSLQTHGEDGPQSYLPSQSQDDATWSSMQSQTTSDDLDHYTFSSPTAGGFTHRNVSSQSSPRSADSPGYFAPSWHSPMPVPEGLALTIAPRECVPAPTARDSTTGGYFQYSSAPFPSVDSRFHAQSFDGSDSSFPMRSNMASMSDHGQSTSPCSSVSGVDGMGPFPTSEPGRYQSRMETGTGSSQNGSPTSSTHGTGDNDSLSPTSQANVKTEEPYAQLIYRAFMSTEPRYAMTLQDIYQWFREHTDKGKSDSKGWQNSIRHNLSMNQAFTKDRKAGNSGSGDEDTEDTPTKSSAADSNANDRKKTTKWYLEPWAVTGGVQSTTRYRKGNPSRRGRKLSGTASTDANMKRSVAFAAARALSGRKGGINKFRVRHEAAMRLRDLNSNTIPLHHYPPLQPLHHRHIPQQLMHGLADGPYGDFISTPAMDFDFANTVPHMYQTTMTADLHQHRLIHRGPSPPVIDEPVTPEPTQFNIKCEPSPHHHLPLHRAGLSNNAPGTFHYATGPAPSGQDHNHGVGVVGIPAAPGGGGYSLHGGNVVGVYDEVAERYGWGGSTTSAASGGGPGGNGGLAGLQVDGLPYCAPY